MTNREALEGFQAWIKTVLRGPSITLREQKPHRQELEWQETVARRKLHNRKIRRKYQEQQSEVEHND